MTSRGSPGDSSDSGHRTLAGRRGNAYPVGMAKLTSDQRNAFLAAFLGWTMDAFDYFLIVLVYSEIAADFGTSLAKMAFVTTVTLAMRPVGALLFGLWADRR